MLDNQLIIIIINTIIAGEEAAGIDGTPIKAAFQPTVQGINSEPTAYLYKIGDKRVGYVARKDVWDKVNEVMVHTETQQYETTFQISALATQDPEDITAYTASDILNLIASILQSDMAVAAFEASGVGILHVSDIRNPYFEDDRQQFEASPNVDFVLTHKQVIISNVPIATSFEIKILAV